MLAPAITAIKAQMAAQFTAWPVRWPNERLAAPVSSGGYPVDAEGNARPFVEAEVIGGQNRIRGVGAPGQRLWIHPGLIRVYIAVPNGTGTDEAQVKADLIAAAFERKEFGSLVRCHDASIFDGVAGFEEGNYYALMLSIDFEFYYQG